MTMIRRKTNEIKIRVIGGEDYYSLTDTAKRLNVSRTTVKNGISSGRFSFAWAKLGDTETSPIFISAKDVEVYIRAVERAFQIRMSQNAQI